MIGSASTESIWRLICKTREKVEELEEEEAVPVGRISGGYSSWSRTLGRRISQGLCGSSIDPQSQAQQVRTMVHTGETGLRV